MDNERWFKEAKFGMMIHWGLYSLLAGEWKGQRMDDIGEWIMSKYEISITEYEQLTKCFNPIYFDAEEWVCLAKEAGMNYIVVTSKHHDGFAMYHSEADSYNVVDATPFGRDIIAELAAACHKYDMKLGLYYSQNLDWHEPHGGGFAQKHYQSNFGMSWDNNWDFPNRDQKDYMICFEKKIKPQVRELLTKYGEICLIWFDTPVGAPESCSAELFEMVKKYQPNCLVNTRIGNGLGDYVSCGDNELPEEYSDVLREAPVTLNDTWGYKSFDANWKSAEKIIELKKRCNDHGANLLLNVGPDGLGRIPAPTIEILKKVGANAK